MANDNLYQKYLGIPGDGKPDYYVLLGIPFKETGEDVISSAAQKRVEQLEPQKNPGNDAEISSLLSEIQVARDCLLNPQKRKQYEFDLLLNSSIREKAATSQSSPQSAAPSPPPSVAPARQPVQDPFAFQSQSAPQPVSSPNPFAFQSPVASQPLPAQDPFGFQSQSAPQPVSSPNPFVFQSPVAPQPLPAQDPFGFQSPMASQPKPQMNPFMGQAPAPAPAPSPVQSSPSSHSRKKGPKPDNTPYIIAIVGGVVILMIALWSMGRNSPRSQAERYYNLAVTAVNSYRYDEARELMDRAIALDRQESYVKYRESIDRKQRNHEYTLRHKAAREAEDEVEEEWK